MAIYSIIAGSMSPERVPITSPSSGVRPIEVSTQAPFNTAEIDAPFPKCATMILEFLRSMLRNSAHLFDTKLWLVPWNPYRLTPYFS